MNMRDLLRKGYRGAPDPQVDTIWVVVPLSRPEFLNNVVCNFTEQKFYGKKLVIVENGDAVGICKKRGFQCDLILTSDKHQSHAKNTALAEIRKHGGGFWTTFDDDDYYGPDYLTELSGYAKRGDLIGKLFHFIRTTDGFMRVQLGQVNVPCEIQKPVAGPTISAWAEDCPDFAVVNTGEDTQLFVDMFNKGAKVFSTSPWHFAMIRRESGHTWKATDEQMVQHTDDGMFEMNDNHFEYVNGKAIDQCVYIEKQPWCLNDFPIFQEFAEKTGKDAEYWMEDSVVVGE